MFSFSRAHQLIGEFASSVVGGGFNISGVKQVRYRVTIKCDANRTVTVLQRRYEDDRAPDADDYIGATVYVRNFGGSGHQDVSTLVSLRKHRSRQRGVLPADPVPSHQQPRHLPWTGWQNSPILTIPN